MFLQFSLKDAVDILLVGLLLYYLFRLMRESRSLNVFIGIMVFLVVWIFVSVVFEMRLLGAILDKLVSVGVIALIVLFQEDIRNFLYNLGAHRRIQLLKRFFTVQHNADSEDREQKRALMPVVMAAMRMGQQKVGALIVIEQVMPLDAIVSTGEVIDAQINQRLIENIFFKNSPLHDGAMVISKRRIKAAGCILPVSHSLDIPKELGLRHRAALGMSQESDAVVVVVSEETGGITVAHRGELHLHLSAEELESLLTRPVAA